MSTITPERAAEAEAVAAQAVSQTLTPPPNEMAAHVALGGSPAAHPARLAHTKTTSQCLAKAHQTEPIFVIRAQDKSAVAVIQKWIDLNTARLGEQHPKIVDAVLCRDLCAAWPYTKDAD